MLEFILGLFVGGIVGFAVCAICSMAGSDEHAESQYDIEPGDSDARSE